MLDQLAAEFARPLSLPFPVIALRLFMSILLGGLIGWEREIRGREAGLRTHMLITLASATFTLVAVELVNLTPDQPGEQRTDPIRLIEAVTAGVAFLAAGSIIFTKGDVQGITTGASMWHCGAIGLCCGTGDLQLAMMATALGLVVLWLVKHAFAPTKKD